ncbi:MAG: nucleotide exchange factor GrpE [Thermoplasmatota archaeon]
MTDHQKETREPLTEIIEMEDGAMLISELPGVPQDSIKMAVSGDILKLDAEGPRNKFSTIQPLPFEPDPDRISVTFSQGVLEVSLKHKGKDAEKNGDNEQETSMSISLGSMEKELLRMKEELEKVSEERGALEERVNFLKRDFKNIKRRHETEKESIADRKVEEIAHGLVEVLDSFRYAKDSIISSKAQAKNIDPMLKGIEMVENKVRSLFERIGITKIEAVGRHFDPNLHESVGKVSRADLEDGVVAEEVKPGYLYKGRALRPSQVLVNSGAEEKDDGPKKNK